MTQMMGLSRTRNGFWSIQFSNIKSKLCQKGCVNFLSELAANCDAKIPALKRAAALMETFLKNCQNGTF